jgi:hypothetical protein
MESAMVSVARKMAILLALATLPSAVLAAPTIDSLARDVDRAESLRAVKNLQRSWAQYSQVGLWTELGKLYAKDGKMLFEGNTTVGGDAIAASLRKIHGEGKEGLPPGALHSTLIEQPLANLSADGESAKVRWYGFFLQGDGKGAASIQGGVYENEYVREGGKWKIALSHFTPQYAGPYETGWSNWKGQDLGYVPFHFTSDETGIPIPPTAGAAPKSGASLASLQKRIAALNDEDKVRNLQNAYGYYVDRKMWDDVVDLFAAKSAIEIGGIGVYDGKPGVRRAMERMGPAGLTHGQLNDRPLFDTVVTISPGGTEAHARGIELGMLGEADKNEGYWEVNVFDNRFVKEGGVWKIREMRIFPLMRTDYYQGWGKSRLVEAMPTGSLAPDHPVPAADRGPQDRLIPHFAGTNPATGQSISTAPGGMTMVATTPLTGAIAPAPAERPASLAELQRRLAVSTAWDGAENVSTAYGMYVDDSQWRDMGAIFGKHGAKQVPFAGYYLGVERITNAVIAEYGEPKTTPRAAIPFHWRIQPVINVASDGRSANVRTYLFHPNTSESPTGFLTGLSVGMYQDQMVLEDGIWRIWNLTLDEPYFQTVSWKGGWSGAKDRPGYKVPELPILKTYPPDLPISIMGKREEHFRGGSGDTIEWPGILPMWFPYRNPVSGRVPEHYITDCGPCEHAPDLSMTRHGYLLPPN